MFNLGVYEVKIDNKGRMRLPSKFLETLGSGGTRTEFVINRGSGKCLGLYTEEMWRKETKDIERLDMRIQNNLKLARLFFLFAEEVKVDNAVRINIPKRLLRYAGIEGEAIISTFAGRIEMYSPEEFDDIANTEPEDFSALMEEVLAKNKKED